jgi:hypothetical protein
MGGFVEKLHGAGAKALQGVERDRAERRPRACIIRVVVPALINVLKSCSVARGTSCR